MSEQVICRHLGFGAYVAFYIVYRGKMDWNTSEENCSRQFNKNIWAFKCKICHAVRH